MFVKLFFSCCSVLFLRKSIASKGFLLNELRSPTTDLFLTCFCRYTLLSWIFHCLKELIRFKFGSSPWKYPHCFRLVAKSIGLSRTHTSIPDFKTWKYLLCVKYNYLCPLRALTLSFLFLIHAVLNWPWNNLRYVSVWIIICFIYFLKRTSVFSLYGRNLLEYLLS